MIPSGNGTRLTSRTVYQRGVVIDSQPADLKDLTYRSISKGSGD